MNEPHPTDEESIAAFRDSGDAQVVSRVVRRHVTRVRSMILQMIPRHADADDLIREAFLRAIRGFAGFRGGVV